MRLDELRGPDIRAVREQAKLARHELSAETGMTKTRIMQIELERRRWQPEEMAILARGIHRLVTRRAGAVTAEIEIWLETYGAQV